MSPRFEQRSIHSLSGRVGLLGMFKKAISRVICWCLDRMIKATPENAYNIVRRGYFRADHGDYDGAIADLSMAIELVPHYGDAFRLRAMTSARTE